MTIGGDSKPNSTPNSKPNSRPNSNPNSAPNSNPNSRPNSKPNSNPNSRPNSKPTSASASRSHSPARTVSPPPPCPVIEGASVNPDLWTHKMINTMKIAADDSASKRHITIDDIAGEGETDKHQKLSSPRSIEACLELGIDPKELHFRPLESFHDNGLSQDLIQIKFEHYEKIRKDKISKLQAERANIIQRQEEDRAAAEAAAATSGGSSSKDMDAIMEEKIKKEQDKERHRLEVLLQAEAEHEKHVEQLVEKAEAAEHVHQKYMNKKQAEHARKVILKQLELEERRARVESMKRAKAFQRYQTLQRIEAETERVNKLLASKAKRLERHCKANISISDHRQSVLQQMERLSVTKKWRESLSDEDKAKLGKPSKNKK